MAEGVTCSMQVKVESGEYAIAPRWSWSEAPSAGRRASGGVPQVEA